jgi:hypothetical protein
MLYKYRGITAFRYLADIFVKSRLYAAPYDQLNDPMEGMYVTSDTGDLDEDMRKFLDSAKQNLRVCSLTKSRNNFLMWSHYAEGHRGVVVGVDIVDKKSETREVIYDGPMQLGIRTVSYNTPRELLSHKLVAWSYEEEVRVFVENGYYVSVEIREVIFGSRMSNQEKSFLREFLRRVCPTLPIIDSEVRHR